MKGDELKALTVWVWSSFQLGGVSLTPDELEDEASKIMAHVDENTNGKLSFDEFEAYFRRTCKSTEKFRESKPRVIPQSPQRRMNRSGGARCPVSAATAEAPATAKARDTEEAPAADASAEQSADGDACPRPHPPLAPSAADVMIARLRVKALRQSAASADPRAAATKSDPQGGAGGTAASAAADFPWLEGDKVPLVFAASRPVNHFLYGHGFAVAVNPAASMPFLVRFHDGSSAEYAWACSACPHACNFDADDLRRTPADAGSQLTSWLPTSKSRSCQRAHGFRSPAGCSRASTEASEARVCSTRLSGLGGSTAFTRPAASFSGSTSSA